MASGMKALLRLFRPPELVTYEESREALGGAPWQRFDSTESWFQTHRGDERTPTPASPTVQPVLDTAAYRLEGPSWTDGLRRVPWRLIGGAMGSLAFIAVALTVLLAPGDSRALLPPRAGSSLPAMSSEPTLKTPTPRADRVSVPSWLVQPTASVATQTPHRSQAHKRKVQRVVRRKHHRRA